MVPPGFYDLESMVESVVCKGEVLMCGTSVAARALSDEELLEGARRSTMDALAARTIEAGLVLVF